MENQEALKKSFGESESSFTPSYESEQQKRFRRIKKHVLKRFEREEYEKLKQDMVHENLSHSDIKNFFNQEGRSLLVWAISYDPSNKALAFLKDFTPLQYLKDCIKTDDFSIIRSYIFGESGSEEIGMNTKDDKNSQALKFKLLLSIDAQGIINFMSSEKIQQALSPILEDSYFTAKGEYSKQPTKELKFNAEEAMSSLPPDEEAEMDTQSDDPLNSSANSSSKEGSPKSLIAGQPAKPAPLLSNYQAKAGRSNASNSSPSSPDPQVASHSGKSRAESSDNRTAASRKRPLVSSTQGDGQGESMSLDGIKHQVTGGPGSVPTGIKFSNSATSLAAQHSGTGEDEGPPKKKHKAKR